MWKISPRLLAPYFRTSGYAQVDSSDEVDEEPKFLLPGPEYLNICSPGIRWSCVVSWLPRLPIPVSSCLQVLLPSFLIPHNGRSSLPRQLHPSAWLDGLRGVAAFFVVWHHASLLWFSSEIHNGYDTGEQPELNHRFIQLPFVRLLVSGAPQVMVFFVISGYALSYKPLRLLRQGREAEFGDALASSLFRRHPRLFLPALGVTFFSAVAAGLGWYGTEGWDGVAWPSREPPRAEGGTLSAQLYDWVSSMVHLADPISIVYGSNGPYRYDPNLWTLPIELTCSMYVFLALAAFSRIRHLTRMTFVFGLMVFTNWHKFWEPFLFLSGLWLADLNFHLHGTKEASPLAVCESCPPAADDDDDTAVGENQHQCQPQNLQSRLRNVGWITSFLLAVHVLSYPDTAVGAKEALGYRTLSAWVPAHFVDDPDRFWLPIAAVWLVFTVDRAPFLQSLFTNRPVQYLGRISFALYLVHGTLLWTYGWHLGKYFVDWTGRDTDWQHFWGIFCAFVFFLPVLIWAADLANRYIDVKVVNFGKKAGYGLPVHHNLRCHLADCSLAVPAEIFPLNIRSKGNAWGVVGWSIGNGWLTLLCPVMFNAISEYTLFICAASNVVTIPMVYCLYPEINQRTLEEMNLLFAADSPWVWDAEQNYKILREENPELVQTGRRRSTAAAGDLEATSTYVSSTGYRRPSLVAGSRRPSIVSEVVGGKEAKYEHSE
ncbi:hypothetical protein DV736_g5095, partial [Chaetothyriales sp. CBS 134916]